MLLVDLMHQNSLQRISDLTLSLLCEEIFKFVVLAVHSGSGIK